MPRMFSNDISDKKKTSLEVIVGHTENGGYISSWRGAADVKKTVIRKRLQKCHTNEQTVTDRS